MAVTILALTMIIKTFCHDKNFNHSLKWTVQPIMCLILIRQVSIIKNFASHTDTGITLDEYEIAVSLAVVIGLQGVKYTGAVCISTRCSLFYLLFVMLKIM